MRTDDCLADYLEKIGTDFDARNLLCDFCGVIHSTGKRWAAGNSPIGINLVKLRYALVMLGYTVDELLILPPEIYKFGELVAFGTLTFDDAVQLLEFTQPQNLLRILHGREGTRNDRIAKMVEVIETFDNDLNTKKAIWLPKFKPVLPSPTPSKPSPSPSPVPTQARFGNTTSCGRQITITTVISLSWKTPRQLASKLQKRKTRSSIAKSRPGLAPWPSRRSTTTPSLRTHVWRKSKSSSQSRKK